MPFNTRWRAAIPLGGGTGLTFDAYKLGLWLYELKGVCLVCGICFSYIQRLFKYMCRIVISNKTISA